MNIARWAEQAMAMDDSAWRRHANPWSVWTRVPILPLIALSLFARVWIGWWCVLPLALLLFWIWLNPRAFPRPEDMTTWSARGTMGERVWIARKAEPIPPEFARAAFALMAASAIGLLILGYGLTVLDPWATIAGLVLAQGGKMWFVDRMAWLYDVAGNGRFRD